MEAKVDPIIKPLCHFNLIQSLRHDSAYAAPSDAQTRWQRVLESKAGREAYASWVLGNRHIHAVTCVGMARREFGLARRPFDMVLVDEAGKAFLAEILLPASVAKKLILVGDHFQLPPTVTDDAFDEGIAYRLPMEEVEEILKRNMFEDFFEELPSANKGMLTHQHRMHKDIGDLVSEMFYGGRLTSAKTGSDWPFMRRRLQFIDFTKDINYRHRHGNDGNSLANAYEREVLFALLDRLASQDAHALKVLVICPYKLQRQLVGVEISKRSYPFSLTTTTVDAVQGGQATLVILLMTRSSGRVEFLLDRNRLNVALSRAEEAVVILGHLACLSPEGQGPMAQLIQIGERQDTLQVLNSRARKEAIAILPSQIFP